jgi:GntR family transcriptional regulator
MSPTAGPGFRRIADHYRAAIASGEYREGDKLPTYAEVVTQFKTASSTVTSAMRQLQAEKLVTITQRGTFVAAPRAVHTPADRLRISRGGIAPGETEAVREAGVIPFGEQYAYVAGQLGVEESGHVVRREKILSHAGQPLGLAVSWYPVAFIAAVPELAVPAPIEGGEAALIAKRTGRYVTNGEDFWEGRGARDEREAGGVGVEVGAPILAGAWVWRDRAGDVIEYGEIVSLGTRVIKYEYEYEVPEAEQHEPQA